MTTIPAEKFEEWESNYIKASTVDKCYNTKCKECPLSKPVKDGRKNVYACMTLEDYLSIKSKEYMEANQ